MIEHNVNHPKPKLGSIDKKKQAVDDTVGETCMDLGEDPTSVSVRFEDGARGYETKFEVALPPEITLALRMETRVGGGDGISRKRDPMARFEIDVEDEGLRKQYRIVGAPADLVKAVFTEKVKTWINRKEVEVDINNKRELVMIAPELQDTWIDCDIGITIDYIPDDLDAVREYVSELIAIKRHIVELVGGLRPPDTQAIGEIYRGAQAISDPAAEASCREFELEAYFKAQSQPESLSTGELRQIILWTLFMGLVIAGMVYAQCQKH